MPLPDVDADTLVAIALVITSIGGILSPILLFINGRASKRRGEEQIKQTLMTEATIVKATDGVVTKLLEEKDKTAVAQSELSAVEGHQQGIRNGRAEARLDSIEKRIEQDENKERMP